VDGEGMKHAAKVQWVGSLPGAPKGNPALAAAGESTAAAMLETTAAPLA
jgi:hypothetical protein